MDKIRKFLGVTFIDLPRYLWALNIKREWEPLTNRSDVLERSPDIKGFRCDGRWTSSLLTCSLYPFIARQIMERAFINWPVKFAAHPQKFVKPELSVIIAFRGRERINPLLSVLRSFAGQEDVPFECIVVEQSSKEDGAGIPGWVKHIRAVNTLDSDGWYKSWAYNIGAREARGDILLFHDADICAPKNYLREIMICFNLHDVDVVSLQRFLFYLDKEASFKFENSEILQGGYTPETVLQNWQGGTIAVKREAFFSIGGFDEGFVNWGGEDCEFFDRCTSRRYYNFGYLPFIHLWHTVQRDRHSKNNFNTGVILPERLNIPIVQRISELTKRAFGNKEKPDPLESYTSQVVKGLIAGRKEKG